MPELDFRHAPLSVSPILFRMVRPRLPLLKQALGFVSQIRERVTAPEERRYEESTNV